MNDESAGIRKTPLEGSGPDLMEGAYRAFFESSPDALCITDSSGAILAANPAFAQLFGCQKQDLAGFPFGKLLEDPSSAHLFFPGDGSIVEISDRELRLKAQTGGALNCRITSSRLRTAESGRVTGLLAVKNRPAEKTPPGELEKIATQFRTLSENALDIIYITGPNGAFSYVNPAWKKILGHSPEEVLDTYFIDYVKPDDTSRIRRMFRAIRDQGVTVSDLECEILTKDDQVRQFSLSAAPHFDNAGSFMGIVGIFRDTTQRVLAERELAVARAYSDQLIETAPEALVILDNYDTVKRINSTFTRIFGYTSEEAVGRPINDLIVQEELKDEGLAYTRRAMEGSSFEAETRRRRKNGRLVDVSILATPIWIDGGKVGVYAVYRDITKRKRTEDALVESEQRFRDMADLLPTVIAEVDDTGFLTYANRMGLETFGYTEQDLKDGLSIMGLVHPDDRELTSKRMRQVFNGETKGPTEYKMLKKNGEMFYALVTSSPIRQNGGIIGLRTTIQDITKLRQAEDEIRVNSALLNGLIDNAPEAIAIMDRDEKILRVNEEFTRLFQYGADECLGSLLDEMVLPEDLEDEGSDVTKRSIRGEAASLETIRLNKSGDRIPVSILAAPITDGRGTWLGYFGIYRDITARKKSEAALRESEAKYRTILDNIEDGYYEVDLEGKILMATDSTERIVGSPKNSFLGKSFADYCDPENAKRVFAAYHEVYATGRANQNVMYTITTESGEKKELEASASLIRDKDGQPIGFRGIIRDMTAGKAAEEALRESERRHRTVLETVPDPVAVRDRMLRIIYVNPAFKRVFGWTPEDLADDSVAFIPHDNLTETMGMDEKLVHGRSFTGVETRRLSRGGRVVNVSISGAPFFDGDGRVGGNVLTLQDITERKRAEEDLRYVAFHDLLTGLPNRRAFYERMMDVMIQSGRRKKTATWALLFLDLDKFKNINDSLGHDVGDKLLQASAGRIRSCLRKSDHIFRLGGDEFMVILTNLNDGIEVAKVARKIRNNMTLPFNVQGHEIYTATSIGISVYPTDGQDVETLVKNADMAMYSAKESDDGYCFYTEKMQLDALERMKLEINLRLAMEKDEFILYYQPLVDQSERILGMEALLRWEHPELGLVPPSKFITLAEETGIIVPIGNWVLKTACMEVKKMQLNGFPNLYVAVNLSPRQFREEDLVETIQRVLDETDLAPDHLKLEITESSVMDDPEAAIYKMKVLREMGIRISIDDFGTGYSSLSYLRRFPIDTLKIDRSFISDSMNNRDDREIVKTIIAMARNLNIEAVAEGVETKDHKEFLCDQGCSLMQGYLFSRPIPSDQFRALLAGTVSVN